MLKCKNFLIMFKKIQNRLAEVKSGRVVLNCIILCYFAIFLHF